MVMKYPCHYPDLCTTGAFPSSRSDGVNLAVGFNPSTHGSLHNRRISFVAKRRREFRRGFQPTGRRDHSSLVASATIEPGWWIAPTHNLRRNQSLALALALVGSIVATRRGKYLTRNRGLKPTAKFIRPLRGGRNRA